MIKRLLVSSILVVGAFMMHAGMVISVSPNATMDMPGMTAPSSCVSCAHHGDGHNAPYDVSHTLSACLAVLSSIAVPSGLLSAIFIVFSAFMAPLAEVVRRARRVAVARPPNLGTLSVMRF